MLEIRRLFSCAEHFRTRASNTIIQALQRGTKAEDMEEGLSREGTRVLLSYNYISISSVPGPKLQDDRSYFVLDLALCISSSGY